MLGMRNDYQVLSASAGDVIFTPFYQLEEEFTKLGKFSRQMYMQTVNM